MKAPSGFTVKDIGRTLVTRTQGTKVSSFFFPFIFTYFICYCLTGFLFNDIVPLAITFGSKEGRMHILVKDFCLCICCSVFEALSLL